MKSKIKCGIYKITNTANGKIIIGQSIHIFKRWRHYKNRLRRNKHENPHLQASWNKYGELAFIFEIILLCPVEKLDEEEIRLIKEHNSMDQSIGYNLSTGGNRPKFSEETIQKMRNRWKNMPEEMRIKLRENESKARMGTNNAFFGKHHTEETKRKISLKKKGKCFSEETKKKMSISQTGRKHSEETKQKMRNKTFTEEQRRRMSEAKKGKHPSEETKQKIRDSLLKRNNHLIPATPTS